MIKRIFKVLVSLTAICFVGLTVLVAYATVRLSMGPITLDMLTPHIERGLNAEGGNFKITLDGTALVWSQAERDLDIVVKNVRVTNRKGEEQAFVPEIAIGLSVRALLGAEFRPTRFEFFRPRMRLVRGKDGRIQFGDPLPLQTVSSKGDSAAKAAKARDVALGGKITAEVLGSLLTQPPPNHPLHYLKTISLNDAALEFEDLGNNFRLTSPASDLLFVRGSEGVAVSAHLSLTVAGKSAPVSITGGYRSATKKIQLKAQFKNLELARLAKLSAALGPLTAARFSADGSLGLTMDTDGRIDEISLDATARAGKLVLQGLYAKPIELRAMRIKARVDDNFRRFRLDHLTADLGGPRIGLTGQAIRKGGKTSVTLDVRALGVSVQDLKRLWPKEVASSAREWVVENIEQGKVGRADAHVELAMGVGPKGRPGAVELRHLDGGFDFADLTIHYLRPMPPIKGLTGRAKVSKAGITFTSDVGRVQGLRLNASKVYVTGLDLVDKELLKVETIIRGPLPAALVLLDHPRLDLIKGFGMNPSEVAGEMATRLVIELPLLKAVTFDMVEVLAASNLRNVKLTKAALDADVTEGDLTLQVDKKGMDVNGTIRLGGVAADLAWTENFYSGARFQSRYGVKGVIDDGGRKRLGLSSEPHVMGPLGFDLVVTRFDDKRTGISGTLDVKTAALDFSEIEWFKKPGVGGFARFSLNLQDGKVRHIPNLSVKAGDLDALGSVRLAADGITVESFKFSKLIFGESDIGVSGQARPDGGLDLTVTGAMVDVRPFLESQRKEGPKRPLSIKVDVAEARVGPGPTISSVQGSLSRGSGDWRNMTIRGTVGKNHKPVLLLITPGKNSRNLNITSNDAGATLRSFGINEDMIGGKLTISGKYDDTKPGAPLNAMLRVKEFQMVRAPMMVNVLNALSLVGMLDALSGKGITFDELEAPFTMKGDDLRIRDARAYGAALGFTAKGWVDLEKDQLDITGTVVPAYSLNSILGHIPILGRLLTGEKGSGVFAATYRMHGKIADPKVSHNPLATLAPGFLRGLFNIFEESPKKPPSEQKKAAPAPVKPGNPDNR